MSNIKFIAFFLILFVYPLNTVFAQNVASTSKKNILWQNSVSSQAPFALNYSISTQFINGVFLPCVAENLPTNGKSEIIIKNPQFEVLVGYDYFKRNQLKNLKSELLFNSHSVIQGTQLYTTYNLCPFKFENGQYYYLKSYDVEIKILAPISSSMQSISNKRAVTNSVLATGQWVKFSVSSDGMYKLDKAALTAAGINVNTVDPRTIKIYGHQGGMLPEFNGDFRYDDIPENAIQVIGENDGQFNDNDYVLFYAQSPHKWKYLPALNRYKHEMNIYSDKTYFFLTYGGSQGKRVSSKPNGSNLTPDIAYNWYDYLFFHDEEKENICNEGRIWLGERLDQTPGVTFNHAIPFLNTQKNIQIYYEAGAVSPTNSNLNVAINGQSVSTMNFSLLQQPKYDCFTSGGIGIGTAVAIGTNVKLDFNYNRPTSSSRAWLNYFEIHASSNLEFNGSSMTFRNIASAQNAIVEYQIKGMGASSLIYDVSDPVNPKIQTFYNNGSLNIFRDVTQGKINEFIVFNENFGVPVFEGAVANQNIHNTGVVQYIIVAPKAFLDAANKLADFHRTTNNLSVLVITPDLIYNEFSSGSQDISALRDYFKLVYYNNLNPVNSLKYVMLMGDASFDYKDKIANNTNFVPTYESEPKWNIPQNVNGLYYCSDDFFGYLDSLDGRWSNEQLLEIVVARMPVASAKEAMDMVNKILNYKSPQSLGNWRTNITLCADDADESWETMFVQDYEEISNLLDTTAPNVNINKIYFDAFKQQNLSGSQRYPDAQIAIKKDFESGTMIFNYVGHGGEQYLASEKVIDIPLINGLKNINTLPVFFTATCEFSRFDDARRKSAGEYVYTNPDGGAIAMYTTTRIVGASENAALTYFFWSNCAYVKIGGRWPTMGEIYKKMKNRPFGSRNDRFFAFFGDPALTMNYPEDIVKIDSVNGKSINVSNLDTMKALSRMTFVGHIEDVLGNKVNAFNGKVNSGFFDKQSQFLTLGNDNAPNSIIPFNLYSNPLFKGENTVESGSFKISFVVPKDINYNFGLGKFVFYADNQLKDAWGTNRNIVIGGTNSDAAIDEVGPEIEIAINDYSFVSGGITNNSPILLAKLFDENGINTSGNGIGRDIIAIIDKGTPNEKRYVLNNFYKSQLNSYTNGEIEFKIEGISIGKHTYTLKVWDVYNNSSEATIEFNVLSSESIAIENLLNYPNPFNNRTIFHFDHNKPGETLDIVINIYTITGKVVKTIQQSIYNANIHVSEIEWNGRDDFDDKLSKGVYIYKLNVKTSDGKSSNKTEKLVILN
ncbi:MAG: type IX secretion system sortase PorU [Bacteroidota bacterium]|nr:type IX secretion system sortase PorU [Bacteroidota bacterium]